ASAGRSEYDRDARVGAAELEVCVDEVVGVVVLGLDVDQSPATREAESGAADVDELPVGIQVEVEVLDLDVLDVNRE
ncbi:MAG: hypothetical protein ACYTFV_17445, partial [Planctomycetota bacterium]